MGAGTQYYVPAPRSRSQGGFRCPGQGVKHRDPNLPYPHAAAPDTVNTNGVV